MVSGWKQCVLFREHHLSGREIKCTREDGGQDHGHGEGKTQKEELRRLLATSHLCFHAGNRKHEGVFEWGMLTNSSLTSFRREFRKCLSARHKIKDGGGGEYALSMQVHMSRGGKAESVTALFLAKALPQTYSEAKAML